MKVTKEEMCIKSIELFKEKGFDNVSVSDICKAFDVTRGSFYHHFADKNDLLLYWQKIQSDINSTQTLPRYTQSALENLRLFTNEYAESISSLGYELLYRTMNAACKTDDSSFVKENSFTLLEASMEQFLHLIKLAQEDKKITDTVDSIVLAKHYNLALAGLAYDWYAAKGEFDFVKEADSIFSTIFR